MSRSKASLLMGAVLLVGLLAWPGVAQATVLELLSLSSAGVQGNGTHGDPCISGDGRYVAFASTSTNLVAGDSNGKRDIFVRDRQSGETTLVSKATNGTQGNEASHYPSISGDGRYVAFMSLASNLVDDDTNDKWDIFVHDRQTGTTIRVSVATNGDEANGDSRLPAISANGRHVAFESDATDLVTGDTYGYSDVFVHEMLTLTTERVSLTEDGQQATGHSNDPSISADGNLVAFESTAADLVSGDTNNCADIFVRDRSGLATERVNLDYDGTESDSAGLDPSISGDGRYVAFRSSGNLLVSGDTNGYTDIFVRDLSANTTVRASVSTTGAQTDRGSYNPSISADGSHVAFESEATTLWPGDTNAVTDVFVRRLASGTTALLSLDSAGTLGNGVSMYSAIDGDGTHVVFQSSANNLAPSDANYSSDIFAADTRPAPTITSLEPASGPTAGGNTVIIHGTGFIEVSDVYFDLTNLADAPSFYVNSDVRITAIAPAHAAGTIRVRVKAAGGTTADTGADNYTYSDGGPPIYTSYRGSDRYFTALLLSQAAFPAALPAGSGVVLAPGTTFPEALCGAPLATAYGGPVLLTPTTGLHPNVRTELQRLDPDYVFVVGLSTTIRNNVQTALPAASVTSIGTTGGNIYSMSRNVANALGARVNATGGDISGAVGLVTIGTKFPDALGLGPLACAKKWPIILTDQTSGALHTQAIGIFTDLGITQMIKVGTYSTPPAGVTAIANLSGSTPPGVNSALARYYTNANVAGWAYANAGLSFAHTAVTTGDKFPDALASGPFLAQDLGILLLSPLSGPVPAVIQAELTAHHLEVQELTFIACIEPVVGTVKGLLP